MLLPEDVLCAPSVDDAGARAAAVKGVGDVGDDLAIVDIGPRTIERYANEIRRAKTIFWNGPLGVFEIPAFATGTKRVAELLASSGATTIVGGGESVQAVEELGLADKMTHVSTGGGASLELIEGKTLPGVAAIPDRTEVHAMSDTTIEMIRGREILDSRGDPTVAVDIILATARAARRWCRPARRPGRTRPSSCVTETRRATAVRAFAKR